MIKNIGILFFCTLLISHAQKSLLTAPVNSILYNESDPVLNGKGNTLLLKSESAQEPAPYWAISYGNGNAWSTPMIIDGLNFSNKTIKNISPSFDFEGNRLFFSSNRFGGIGSGDIWVLQKSGTTWQTKPSNLGMPINSKEYETDPFMAPDEKTLYFVRYNTNKTSDGQPCGDLYWAVLSGKNWMKPQRLPAPINTGCECSPQILNDNKTLVFASQRAGGKGGYDLYQSKLNDDNTWTEPVALDFYNTTGDDRGISIPAQGNILYSSVQGKNSKDIQRQVLPLEFQPAKTTVLSVKTLGNGIPINTKLTLKNLTTGSVKEYLLFSDRDNKVFLHAPYAYELLYTDPTKKYLHGVEYMDMSQLTTFVYKNKNITLTDDASKWQASLPSLINADFSLNQNYNEELKRVANLSEESKDTVVVSLVNSGQDQVNDSLPSASISQTLGSVFPRLHIQYENATEGDSTSKGLINKEAIIRFKKP